jgi:hypothetical protein
MAVIKESEVVLRSVEDTSTDYPIGQVFRIREDGFGVVNLGQIVILSPDSFTMINPATGNRWVDAVETVDLLLTAIRDRGYTLTPTEIKIVEV